MWLWMIVFWIIVIGGAAWLLVSWTGDGQTSEAMSVLRRRLASGELDIEEFERRAAALSANDRRGSPGLFIAVLIALALVIAIPGAVMAANGWDMNMWSMHARGNDTSDGPVVRSARSTVVRIEDFAFTPGNVEVPVGASVTWTNADSAPHDATARNGEWRINRLSKGERETLIFTNAGSYEYYCSIHPNMRARISVR